MENKEIMIMKACATATATSIGNIMSGLLYFRSMTRGDVAVGITPLLPETCDSNLTEIFNNIKLGVGVAGNIKALSLTGAQHQKDRVGAIRSAHRKEKGSVMVLRTESIVSACAPNIEITIAAYNIDDEYGMLTLLSRR